MITATHHDWPAGSIACATTHVAPAPGAPRAGSTVRIRFVEITDAGQIVVWAAPCGDTADAWGWPYRPRELTPVRSLPDHGSTGQELVGLRFDRYHGATIVIRTYEVTR